MSAIDDLEKLAKTLEDANTDDLSMLDLVDRLRALATSLRAEVRERERKAFVEGWLKGYDIGVMDESCGMIRGHAGEPEAEAERRFPCP